MNSQLTLVDSQGHPVPSEGNTVLIFDEDDMQNTTLRMCNHGLPSPPSYSVLTLGNQTMIYGGDREYLLATVTRRTFRRDQISFPGSKTMSLGYWLKSPILSPFPLVFHAHGRRFEWRSNILRELMLCESSRPDDIVAWFSKSQRGQDQVMHAAHLTIKPHMDRMRDLVVLSCILAEQKLVQVLSAEERRTATYTAHVIF